MTEISEEIDTRLQKATCSIDRLIYDYPSLGGYAVKVKLLGKDLIGWQLNQHDASIELYPLLAGFDCVIYNDTFDVNIKKRGRLSLQYGLFIFDEDIYYRNTVCGNCVPASLAIPKHSILNGDCQFLRSDQGFHCHSCFLESLQPFKQTAKFLVMSANVSESLKHQNMTLNPSDLLI